ncbi:MAG: glycosyltransferase [Saprospirales bacterium]|nr:glycosyltransferase [Saprospirales bacterium]
MKILLLSPAHPLRGGIAASSERLAQALQQEGHEVLIFSFRLQYPAFLFPGKTQYTSDPPPPGLKIESRLHSINPFNWIASGLAIARWRPDHVIVRFWLPFMGPCLGTALRIARWFSGKKIRVTALADNIIPHEKRPGDRLFARYFLGACDDFVVMSRSVGEEVAGFLGGHARVRFAPHPLYDTYGEPLEMAGARRLLQLPPDAPVVLFFGFIRAYKGLDLLLEALALAPGVHAVVAGECYDDWQPYQDIIDKNQLAGRVHLHTGFIPAGEVRRYFSAADLVVQPYKTATQSGISQIAYHFDKPMIVTDVGGLPEIVADGVSGYVTAPAAPAIAAAMRDFFEHRREAAMQAGVRREKQRFSWGNLVKTLLEG